jgi:hypothetical protein
MKIGTVTVSTAAPLSALRPKNMVQLYGNQIVYLLRKGSVMHLLWGVRDWSEAEFRYGAVIAEFLPTNKRWAKPGDPYKDDTEYLTLTELYALINDGEVCMGGKDCPKHKGAR